MPTSANNSSETAKNFSVAIFFKLFEKKIASLDKYPFTADNLIVQQDAFARLGALSDDNFDELAIEPFASLEQVRKQKDSDLRFGAYFSAVSVTIAIESSRDIHVDYAEFDSEKAVVSHVLNILIMLASGQIKILRTTYNGRICASEILVYAADNPIPRVLNMQADYAWWWSKTNRAGYEAAVLANHYQFDTVTIAEDFVAQYEAQAIVRKFATAELTPLTKEGFHYLLDEVPLQKAGKRPDESIWQLLYKSWEFWLAMTALGVIVVVTSTSQLLPKFIRSYPVILLPISVILSTAIIRLLIYKQQLKSEYPDHPWIRFDTWLHHWHSPLQDTLVLIAILSFGFSFVRMFGTAPGHYINLDQIAKAHPIVYGVQILQGLSLLLVWFRKRTVIITALAALTVANVAAIVAAFAYTNTDVNVPGILVDTAQTSYFVFPVITFGMLTTAIRRPQIKNDFVFETVHSETNLEQRIDRYKTIIHQLQILVGYGAAIAVYESRNRFMRFLMPRMLNHGTPHGFYTVFLVASVLIALSTFCLQFKLLKPKLYSYLSGIVMFGLLIFIIFSVNNNTDHTPAPAWLFMFGALFSLFGMNAIEDKYCSWLKSAELQEALLHGADERT